MGKPHADLPEWIEEYIEFQEEGFERIKFYYPGVESSLEEDDRMHVAPHEILRQRAEKLIIAREAIGASEGIDDADMNIGDLVLGVATEVLLKAITLQHNPKWFMENARVFDNGEDTVNPRPPIPPSFHQCRKRLIEDIVPEDSDLNEEQQKRLDDVLWLIQERRNNAVHFNFHRKGTYQTPHQIYNVLVYLLDHFFDNSDENIVDTLRERKKTTVVQSGIDFKTVDFPV